MRHFISDIKSIRLPSVLLAVAFSSLTFSLFGAAEPQREGDWLVEPDPLSGVTRHTMELQLHPAGEPRPALKHHLIPDAADRVDGNSAIFYLKAMGFFEESVARDKVREFEQQRAAAAAAASVYSEPAPDAWLHMRPEDLPRDEVRDFLSLLSFQTPLVREASQRTSFSLDRNIRDVESPLYYLLPEIQEFRQLARRQSLRTRLAIAEGRLDDAIEILGQQFALANHLGQDEFFVSNLVGMAISSIGWGDALYLAQQPDAPNLYWAVAALPTPLVDMSDATALERNLLYLQIRSLRDVDTELHEPAYWQELFSHRFYPEFRQLLAMERGFPELGDTELDKAAMVAAMAAAYPGARQFLVEQCGISLENVDALSPAQTVLLAVKRYYEQARDDQFKWWHLPYWLADSSQKRAAEGQESAKRAAAAGWISLPSEIILPGIQSIDAAQQRTEQQLALLQTVEAIRQHAAASGGRLPRSLDELALSALPDPISGQPFEYERNADNAVLSGARVGTVQYRLVLRIAQ